MTNSTQNRNKRRIISKTTRTRTRSVYVWLPAIRIFGAAPSQTSRLHVRTGQPDAACRTTRSDTESGTDDGLSYTYRHTPAHHRGAGADGRLARRIAPKHKTIACNPRVRGEAPQARQDVYLNLAPKPFFSEGIGVPSGKFTYPRSYGFLSPIAELTPLSIHRNLARFS